MVGVITKGGPEEWNEIIYMCIYFAEKKHKKFLM